MSVAPPHVLKFRFLNLIQPLILITFFFCIFAGLFWNAPNWWSADDPQILKHAITFHWSEFFFSPSAWKTLSPSNLTPWISASFKADYILFGLQPLPFYIHQWLSAGVALVLFYMACRRWFPPFASGAAVACLMLSRPILEAGLLLMVRHYIEGLAFSLAAVLCFLHGSKHRLLKYAAGFFFMLACTAKEIFVPLPLVLLLLPTAHIKTRISEAWPMLLVLPAYTFWRLWMLQGFGGYGFAVGWHDILRLPEIVLNLIGFGSLWQYGVIAAVLAVWLMNSSWQWKLFICLLLGAVIAPIMPVAGFMTERYVLLPALLTGILVGWAVTQALQWGIGSLKGCLLLTAGMILLVSLWWGNLVHWQKNVRGTLNQMQVEGEYLLQNGSSASLIINPSGPSWYYGGLEWLRENVLKLHSGPRVIFDDYYLITEPFDAGSYLYYTFNRTTRTMERIDNPEALFDKLHESIKNQAYLSLQMSFSNGVLTWNFGPWPQGNYAVIHEGVSIELPRQGKASLMLFEDLIFKLRYTSPDGWRTYSPSLTFQIESGLGQLHWERAAS